MGTEIQGDIQGDGVQRRPLNVALVSQRVVEADGQGRVNLEVARALIRRGHRLSLVAAEADPALVEAGADWIHIGLGRGPTQFVRNLTFARQSARWIREHRASLDTVVANGCVTWAPADLNAVHFVHGAWLRSPVHVSRLRGGAYGAYQKLYTVFNARWEKTAFAEARTVAAVSERVRDELLSIGVDKDKIRVIPNGVDVEAFRPGPANRVPLGLPAEGSLALFAGDLRTPRKNLDTVLHALAQVPDLHLAIVGRKEGSPYPALADTLGVADRAHFLGFRRDMPDLLRAADFALFPSRYEPFGLVALEAMASGRPVITAEPVGAAPLVAEAGGFVVTDPEDAGALAEAMQLLATDPDLCTTLGVRARAVAERHTWTVTASAYADLVEQLAGSVPLSSVSSPLALPVTV